MIPAATIAYIAWLVKGSFSSRALGLIK
jgi:hypothetical protein